MKGKVYHLNINFHIIKDMINEFEENTLIFQTVSTKETHLFFLYNEWISNSSDCYIESNISMTAG